MSLNQHNEGVSASCAGSIHTHLFAHIRSGLVLALLIKASSLDAVMVDDDLRSAAYDDRPLPIGHGQTISQPFIVALMIEMLELE